MLKWNWLARRRKMSRLCIMYNYKTRAGNTVKNVGCPADNKHEYFGCLPQF